VITKFVTVTELKARATQIVTEIENSKEEVIVTKKGIPVVSMNYLSQNQFKKMRTKKED
jgi:antitoxin (DNA-binding transcriptional repressor) of toxin-antitoxin stability system